MYELWMYHDLDDIYVTVKVLMYNVVLYDAACYDIRSDDAMIIVPYRC